MIKTILAVLVMSQILYAAVGDILSVVTSGYGNTINVTFEGMDSSGTHNFGFPANDTIHRDISNVKGLVVIKRPGYDTTGARIWVMDTTPVCTVLTRNYPNNAYDSCTLDGGNVTYTFALNKSIFAADTAWITLLSGIYTQGVASAAYGPTKITNNCTETYDSVKVIGNDTRPPRFVYDTSFWVGFTGIHQSATGGNPLRCVKFYATDNHSHFCSTTVVHSSIDTAMNDSLKVVEYYAKMDLSTFTKGDSVSTWWKAFPIYGDSLYSNDGVNTVEPTPLYSVKKYLFAEKWVMVIDGASGNDATGDTVSEDNFSFSSPPAACATLGGAISRARALIGTADLKGRVKFYVKAGNYALWGATITSGTLSTFNLEFHNWPNELSVINSLSGSTALPGGDSYLYFKGISFAHSTGNMFQSEKSVILDSCFDNRTGGLLIYTVPCSYLINCKMNYIAKIPSNASINAAPAIIRNCEFKYSTVGWIVPYMFIGNRSSNGSALRFVSFVSGMTNPRLQNSFVGFNWMTTNSCLNENMFRDSSLVHGMAFVQNVVEKTTTTSPALQFAADASTSSSVNNILFFNNTVKGERTNGPYQDYILNDVTPVKERKHWVFRNNIFDYVSRGVTSWDAHAGTAGSPRTGNWMTIWANQIRDDFIVSAVDTYYPKFLGTNSKKAGITFSNNGDMNTYMKFVDDNSYVGDATGLGNYHLQATSPAIGFAQDQVYSFDLDGVARNTTDSGAVGAYAYSGEAYTPVHIDSIRFSTTNDTTCYYGDTATVRGVSFTGIDTGFVGNDTILFLAPINDTVARFVVSSAIDTGLCTLVFTDGTSSDSIEFYNLGELPAPTITQNPISADVPLGQYWAFFINQTGATSFVWQDSINTVKSNRNVNNDTIEFYPTVTLNDDMKYFRCIASNESGSDTSTWALLNVTYTPTAIDSIRWKSFPTLLRDSTVKQAARPLDTIYCYGTFTLGDSLKLNLNSTGTAVATIIASEAGRITATIPAGLSGWMSSWVRGGDMAIGVPKRHAILVVRPGGL